MSRKQEYLAEKMDEMITRDETEQIAERIRAYYAPGASEKILQPLVGLPGAGKSVLLKMLIQKLKKEDAYKNMFFCRIDLSDCADEIEVYFKIASRLESHYEKNKDCVAGQKLKQKVLNQFMMIHGWIYGDIGRYPVLDVKGEEPTELVSTVDDAMKQLQENITEYAKNNTIFEKIKNGNLGVKLDIACNLLDKVTDMMPYVNLAKKMSELVVDNVNKYHLKNLLNEIIEAFETKSKREEIFRELLIMAMPKTENGQKANPVIVLDNFQFVQSGELGRNHTWLSNPGGLMGRLNAYWIIAGRSSVVEHFRNVFQTKEIENEISLQGFNLEQARNYIHQNCDSFFEKRGTNEELREAVIEKMLTVCNMPGHDFVINEAIKENDKKVLYYLPYLLNLVVIHFRRLCSDPGYVITADSFVGLDKQEEFIGYYFYKDLSDLMTNAFQIISCLPAWDKQWIEIVRERFDNHLLNATTVLFKTAPMEHLDGERFKLHEGIKDGLFNTSTNYIKYDVLKYLYEKFIEIYGSDQGEKQKEFWYQPQRLQTFMEVVYQYIDLMSDKKGYNEKIIGVVERLYKNNKGRGNVTDSFIRLYSGYIDSIKKFFDIPFVNVQNADLSDENLENMRNVIQGIFQSDHANELVFPDMQWTLYHMECCFKLADLYTNMNLSSYARNLEILCMDFWKHMEHLAVERQEAKDKFWRCRHQRLKAINANAFDNSQEQNYDAAYQYGQMGLELLKESAAEILTLLSDEKKDVLNLIVNPEDSEEFKVNDCKEINSETFEKLKQSYRLLITWKNEISQTESTSEDMQNKLQKIISEMLLVEHQKLRGNFPWYCFYVQDSELNNEECWKFGTRTYWMRRALLEIAIELKEKVSDYQEIMLKSYHNVCVYLYKAGDVQTACILEHEVIEESEKMLLPRTYFNDKAQNRINTIKSVIQQNDDSLQEYTRNSGENVSEENGEKPKCGIFEYLWKKYIYSEKSEDLKKHDKVLEEMQYMGDYYLHMGYYTVSLKRFSCVTLSRYIRFDITDNRTMDSYLRLYVAAVACNEQEMKKLLTDYAKKVLFTHSDREEWKKVAKGLASKVDCLEKLIETADEGGEDTVDKLLDILDHWKE